MARLDSKSGVLNKIEIPDGACCRERHDLVACSIVVARFEIAIH